MSMPWRSLLLLTLLLGPLASLGHEVRPAYLELREVKPGEFAVLWKTPMRGDLRLALAPEFSGRIEPLTPIATRESGAAAVQTWRLRTNEPLRGQSLRIQGLEATMTDALARVEFADGSTWLHRLTPQAPAATIPAKQSGWSVAGEYLKLGVEHILLGVDHLLFVLALLLITRGAWRLIKTITAFTVAHSITLALATLGLVHVPQAPVEAVIALSIVFVAAEILRIAQRARGHRDARALDRRLRLRPLARLRFRRCARRGRPTGGANPARAPVLQRRRGGWSVAVHRGGAERARRRSGASGLGFPRWIEIVPPYAIGSVAMFWVIQRVAAF